MTFAADSPFPFGKRKSDFVEAEAVVFFSVSWQISAESCGMLFLGIYGLSENEREEREEEK